MSTPKNRAASIRQRLVQISKQQEVDFDSILVRFAVERILARLALSPYATRFVLKGAMLFTVWNECAHRPTRDMDLLGFGNSEAEEIEAVFRHIIAMKEVNDGLQFDQSTLSIGPIRTLDAYGGLEVKCVAKLDGARISIHIDIGFGDVITPEPDIVAFPCLLPDFDPPQIRAYPVYTAMAEKIEAAVRLGENNTRMKNFFDLWFMATKFEVDKLLLKKAVQATFSRRGTLLPTGNLPLAFTDGFAERKTKTWQQFLTRNRMQEPKGSFKQLVDFLADYFGYLFR